VSVAIVVLSTENTTRLTALSSAAFAERAIVPETVCPEVRPVSETLGAALVGVVVVVLVELVPNVTLRVTLVIEPSEAIGRGLQRVRAGLEVARVERALIGRRGVGADFLRIDVELDAVRAARRDLAQRRIRIRAVHGGAADRRAPRNGRSCLRR
jgi:hypothetical protein